MSATGNVSNFGGNQSGAVRPAEPKLKLVPLTKSGTIAGIKIKTMSSNRPAENEVPNVVVGRMATDIKMGQSSFQESGSHIASMATTPRLLLLPPSKPSMKEVKQTKVAVRVLTDAKKVDEMKPKSYLPSMAVSPSDKVIKNGKWSPVEDKQLREAVALIGETDFDALAALVPSRSAAQCRDRWTLFLATGLNNSDLTPEEIRLMKKLLPAYVRNRKKPWALLAKNFPDRSSSILKNAWKRYENSVKPKRTASKSDFTLTRSVSEPVIKSNRPSVPIPVTPAATPVAPTQPKPPTVAPAVSAPRAIPRPVESYTMVSDPAPVFDTPIPIPAVAREAPPTPISSKNEFATPAKPKTRPKPLFSPGNSLPEPFTPKIKQGPASRASPHFQRTQYGQLDNSFLSSPTPSNYPSSNRGPTGLFSPGFWNKMDRSMFEQSTLDSSTVVSSTDLTSAPSAPYSFFPSDLQSSAMIQDLNGSTPDLTGNNWSFSEQWRV